MYEILTLNAISNKIFEVLDSSYSVSKDTSSPDAILLRSFNMHDYEIPDSLLAVGRAGAGVNNIPIPEMTAKGIAVFNTPGANANAVKELTIAALLLSSRNITGGINWANGLSANDGSVAKAVEKGKAQFGGKEIFGKTLGIIGLGAIGIKVLAAAALLGMKIVACDPYASDELKSEIKKVGEVVSLDELYAKSDYITLHIPLTDSTREIISESSICKMKDGVSIINLSRAELVSSKDIKKAIEENKVHSYVVDFPTEETINTPGIIAIPHLGASTEEAEENCAVMASFSIKSYLEDGNVINSVNFPSVSVERSEGGARITVLYDGGDATYNKICSLFDSISKNYKATHAEKKGLSYAIFDFSEENCLEGKEVLENLAEIEGILSIRVL